MQRIIMPHVTHDAAKGKVKAETGNRANNGHGHMGKRNQPHPAFGRVRISINQSTGFKKKNPTNGFFSYSSSLCPLSLVVG